MTKTFTYVVSLVAQNSVDGAVLRVSKEFNGALEYSEDEFYYPFPLDTDQTDTYMYGELRTYCQQNGLDISKVDVITKEVFSNDDSVDVYFEKSDSPNVADIKPNINAEIVPTIYKPATPEYFFGFEEDGVITWQWNQVEGCAYKIIDETGAVIGHIGEGDRFFFEKNIKPETTYTRQIIAYNADGESDASDYAFVTTLPETLTETEKTINGHIVINDTNEAITFNQKLEDRLDEPYGRLKKFHSGIGDNKDLFVYKPDKNDIHEILTVNVVGKALNDVEQRVYSPIDVDYYIKAVGEKVTTGSTIDTDYELRIIPWPVHQCMINVKSIISEPFSFEAEYRFSVYYQKLRSQLASIEVKGYADFPKEIPMNKKIHITLRDENGDIPDSDVIYSVNGTGCTIDSSGNLYAMMPGEITIIAYYKYYKQNFSRKVIVTESDLKIIYHEDEFSYAGKYSANIIEGYRLAQKTIPYKKSYTIDGVVNRYELEGIEQYLRNCDNDIQASPKNTVQVLNYDIVYCSNPDVETSIYNNKIYATSTQNEHIFIYSKTIIQDLYVDQKSSLTILNPEDIIYRNKYYAVYTGNSQPTTTLDYIQVPVGVDIYDNNGDIKPAKIEGEKPRLTAHLIPPTEDYTIKGTLTTAAPEKTYNASTFPALNGAGEEFVIEVTELKVDGNLKYSTAYTDVVAEVNGAKYIRFKNDGSDDLKITGLPSEIITPFEEISETFHCTVNGKLPYTADYDGKQNYVTYAPVFKFNTKTQNMEYEVIASNKQEKRIDAEFENGHKYHATTRNGDVLTLSSTDYDTIVTHKLQEVVNTTTDSFLMVEKEEDLTIPVYNPLFNKGAEKAEISACEVTFTSSNPNIRLTPSKMTIDFTSNEYKDQLKKDIVLHAEILSLNQTSWSPYILNGHYFINNEEFYLYDKCDIKGPFCKTEQPVEKEFFADVIANIESKSDDLPIEKLLNGKTSFGNGLFNGTTYENGEIKLAYQTFGDMKIYDDYGEYTSEEVVLGNELTNITVTFEGRYLDYVKCYISIHDGNDWLEFREVGNAMINTYDFFIKKVKIKFALERLVAQQADYSEVVQDDTQYQWTRLGYSSSNLIINDGLMAQSDIERRGEYISPVKQIAEGSSSILVRPVTASTSLTAYKTYIALGTSENFTPQWLDMNEKIDVTGYTHYRYRIVFNVNTKVAVNAVETETFYTNTSQVSVSPTIKSIKTSSTPSEWRFAGTIRKPIVCKLKADMNWYFVTKYNILDIIYPDIAAAGIPNPRIQDVVVNVLDSDIEISYNGKKDGRLMAKTKTALNELVDSKYLDINAKHNILISPMPRLGAPVILLYEGKPLTLICDTGDETEPLWIEETKPVINSIVVASHTNIDEDTLTVLNEDGYSMVEDISENKIKLSAETAETVTLRYQVKYSYWIDIPYDIEADQSLLYVHLTNKTEEKEYKKIQAFYETGEEGCQRLYDIELNPLYNTAHAGFLYLTDETTPATKIRLYTAKTKFKSTVTEDTEVVIEVLDKLDNPVYDVPVRLTTLYGKIKMANNITNKYGIVTARYVHPSYPCWDVISAKVSDSDITTSKQLLISGDNKSTVLSSYIKDSSYVIKNGESVTIVAILFEEDLTPLNEKEIVVEVINESGTKDKQTCLTDLDGKCEFQVTPVIAATDKCEIKVSYLNIENTIYVKVV